MLHVATVPHDTVLGGGPGGRLVATHSTWTVTAGIRSGGFGAMYACPSRVRDEATGTVTVVRDHVMLARVLAVSAVAVALLIRKVRP